MTANFKISEYNSEECHSNHKDDAFGTRLKSQTECGTYPLISLIYTMQPPFDLQG